MSDLPRRPPRARTRLARQPCPGCSSPTRGAIRNSFGRLHEALGARGYEVWVDWEDIPPSAQWHAEIQAGILDADGVIFVISPDSVASEVCARELEHAAERHKRIVPVVRREPEGGAGPELIAALNWVFLRDEDDFDAGIATLVSALETDLDHVRAHTRLGIEAERWESGGRDRSRLLRGAELATAERWLVGVGEKRPPPTQGQREYLLASRQAATRRQRALITGVSAGLIVAIVLGVIALLQRNDAIHQRNVARARFLDAASQASLASDPELGVLLAVQAARGEPDAQTEEALRTALAADHLRRRFFSAGATTPGALWSPEGQRLLVTSPGVQTRIYDLAGAAKPVSLPPAPAVHEVAWDADGTRVAIGGRDPAVYDARTGRRIARLPGIAVWVALSAHGTRAATTDPNAVGHVVDVSTSRVIASFHPNFTGGVTCFAWAPGDGAIAQGDARSTTGNSSPGALDLWNPATGRLLHSDATPSSSTASRSARTGSVVSTRRPTRRPRTSRWPRPPARTARSCARHPATTSSSRSRAAARTRPSAPTARRWPTPQ